MEQCSPQAGQIVSLPHFLNAPLTAKAKTNPKGPQESSFLVLAVDTNNSWQNKERNKKFPPLAEVENACIQQNVQLNPQSLMNAEIRSGHKYIWDCPHTLFFSPSKIYFS